MKNKILEYWLISPLFCGGSGEQDKSSTGQFADTFFETTRRQIVRKVVNSL